MEERLKSTLMSATNLRSRKFPAKKTGHCKGPNNTCRTGHFQVNANEEQLIVFSEGLEKIVHTDNVVRAQEQAKSVLQDCKASALDEFSGENSEATMTSLLACLDKSIEGAMDEKKSEIEFQQDLRINMGSKLAGYSCFDPNVTMTESIQNKTWSNSRTNYNIKMLFDKPASKIAYIEKFASQEECNAVAGGVSLEEVNGLDGLYAKKGDMTVPSGGGTISKLIKRMHSFATESLRIPVDSKTSREVSWMHYGENAEDPRRYDAHCDGLCDGSSHSRGDHIASFVVYCEAAKKGGHTHFSNSGIHITPEVGSAIFYSYFDPLTDVYDAGFTKVTECGVLEGNKKVISHKMRSS
mmetsp:Transcript_372/g.540  ORF Transcript_372/g.540 Transcript_372/m.540 type:complete len:353 (-) Transcript_372:148-1206(-)